MNREDSEVILEVEDYGRGFPPHLVHEFLAGSTLHLGIGLRGMGERLNQLGGSLEIASAQGKTIIRVRQSVEMKSNDRSPKFHRSNASQGS